jgi:hypothetical protein
MIDSLGFCTPRMDSNGLHCDVWAPASGGADDSGGSTMDGIDNSNYAGGDGGSGNMGGGGGSYRAHNPAATPAANNGQQSFANCVKSGTDYFSLQNGLQGISGGRLGTSWASSAFLGSSVSSAITVGQYFSSLFSGSPNAPTGGQTLSTGVGEAVADAAGPAASAIAPRVPNLTVTVVATASVAVSTPSGSAAMAISGAASGTIPLGGIAAFGANALKIFGTVKLPYDLAVGGFSAVVCGIGR